MRNIVYFFGQILFLPHVILFLFSRKKEEIAQDIYARKNFNPSQIHQMYDLSKELLINKYFRTLFYHRTNSCFSKILRVFYPKQSSFIIDVDTKIGGGLQLAHPYSTILNAEKYPRFPKLSLTDGSSEISTAIASNFSPFSILFLAFIHLL